MFRAYLVIGSVMRLYTRRMAAQNLNELRTFSVQQMMCLTLLVTDKEITREVYGINACWCTGSRRHQSIGIRVIDHLKTADYAISMCQYHYEADITDLV